MNRNITIILVVFAIGYFGILAGITINDTNLPETIGNTYIITLEETLTISDSMDVEVPHPLLGTIQYSVDGEACWIVTERYGAFYYKALEECPQNG